MRTHEKLLGVCHFLAGYPLGAFFKGSEIFLRKFKGSEKMVENFKGSENLCDTPIQGV